MKNAKESGAMWYELKQNIENGFNLQFSFRFKKGIQMKMKSEKFLNSSRYQTS
jgi:hypothetical protein